MRAQTLLLLAVTLSLGACGNSRNDLAAKACSAEIGNRLAGKTYQLDLGDLASHAKSEAADTLLLTSTAVFDKGLSTEYKQTYECRTRFDNANTPSVIYLQFNWNTADLKKSE
jgi:hypothetical protein